MEMLIGLILFCLMFLIVIKPVVYIYLFFANILLSLQGKEIVEIKETK